jgi:hypothetical protein
MNGLMGGMGNNKHEPLALFTGVVGVLIGVVFFLQKFSIITLSFEIMDNTYMYFFAGFSIVASLILLMTTLGLIGVR